MREVAMARTGDARSDEASQRRLYARPCPGESTDDFGRRFRERFLALIEEYRQEHPEDGDAAPDPGNEAAVARGRERLRRLREGR
jgi:hypothetical protein